ncbi:hypothetical protein KCP75_22935 [Salmonella enterica subsp. enterica]|nr:hypothetical protein KCP75_22935 [Salmonella enterica subsp. enterica]
MINWSILPCIRCAMLGHRMRFCHYLAQNSVRKKRWHRRQWIWGMVMGGALCRAGL